MKYKIVIKQGISGIALNGADLDSRVQEALSWGTAPSDITIEVIVEQPEKQNGL